MSDRDRANNYWRQLTPEHIAAGQHRAFIGGMWDELGELQLAFMKEQGLKPSHRLLDVGCGALRGGLRFIDYLDPGNYYGLDLNASLIEAGKVELERAGLSDNNPNLLVTEAFEAGSFGTRFDYALAVSLFTHLPLNQIGRCLVRVREVLKSEAVFYASFFEAPSPLYLDPIGHEPGGVTTYYDADPYHQSFREMRWLAKRADLSVERIGEWGHPRGQRMLRFRRA